MLPHHDLPLWPNLTLTAPSKQVHNIQITPHLDHLHVLQRIRHPSVLAHPGHVLHRAIPGDHEAPDPAHDPASLRALLVRQGALPR